MSSFIEKNGNDVSIYLEKDESGKHIFDDQRKEIPWIYNLGSAIFYGICSSCMAFINKIVITTYGFDNPFFIMFCQMAVTISFLEFLRIFHFINLLKYSLIDGWSFFLPTLLYGVNSITALNALKGMSIPMYAAIKRCAPLVTLILSVSVLKKPCPKFSVIIAVLFITFGCLMAGFGDLAFDFNAYTYGFISVVSQGLYLTLVQRGAENHLSTLRILQLNSYNNLPLFITAFLLSNESVHVPAYSRLTDIGFLFCFLLQICMGSLLNYSLFLCTAMNSALTTSLVGVMKSVLQTVIGFFTFGGVPFHPLNIAGLALNTYGGMLYTYSKYKGDSVPKTSAERKA